MYQIKHDVDYMKYKFVWNDDTIHKNGVLYFDELSKLKEWLDERMYEEYVYNWLVDDGECVNKWQQLKLYELDENGEIKW